MSISAKPELLFRTAIYESKWVNLFVDKVRFPNGHVIDQHHLLDFEREAVMAIPRDEHGQYTMVRVCRYPSGGAEWEFPAGSIESGEEILDAAQRETLEETGHASDGHQLLYSYHPMNGIANQVFHIARCRIGEAVRPFDQTEIVEVGRFSEAEIWRMIKNKELQDGYTLTAFLLDQRL